MAGTKGAQTRRAILDAAIARFGQDGFRATSIADIARDAGVGSTATFAYFPNKEALFLAALDEDAAAVIHGGLTSLAALPAVGDWRQTLFLTLVSAVEEHPLARRVLAGMEREMLDRVLEIPALAELRKACCERLRNEQLSGVVRPDIDPVTIANGIVAITLSLLMSVIQVGRQVALTYGNDIAAVVEAALTAGAPPAASTATGPPGSGPAPRRTRPVGRRST